MKKSAILLLIALIILACDKKLNTLEQDYYIIIHNIIPIEEEFINNSSKPIYDLKNLLEKKQPFDIDKTINELDIIHGKIKKQIEEKSKQIQSDIGKKYINVKISYIDNVTKFSKDMLISFKNVSDKSMETFIEELEKSINISGEKINNLLQEENKLLNEIKDMVENK